MIQDADMKGCEPVGVDAGAGTERPSPGAQQGESIWAWGSPLTVMCASTLLTILTCVASSLALHVATRMVMPGIWVYNLFHTLFSAFGSLLSLLTYHVLCIVENSVLARRIDRQRDPNAPGATLSTISARTQGRLTGYSLAKSGLQATVIFVILSIWVVAVKIEWSPINESLGQRQCIPIQYVNGSYTPRDQVGTSIAGGTTFAEVYMYGLPLADGVLGALSSWPLDDPLQEFAVRSVGPTYAIKSTCGSPVEIASSNATRTWRDTTTTLSATLTQMSTGRQMWTITTQYPPGATFGFTGPVQQVCRVTIVFGSGTASITYSADEWRMVTGGQVTTVQIGRTVLQQGSTSTITFDNVVNGDSMANGDQYALLPVWSMQAINRTMNGQYTPSQGALFCNLMQWSTLPDGLYHVDLNYRGVAAAVAATIQYVAMQYDGSAAGTCEYFGEIGGGTMVIDPEFQVIFYVATATCGLVAVVRFLTWLIPFSRGEFSSRILKSLRYPVLFAHDMRAVVTEFKQRTTVDNDAHFKDWCDHEVVAFGAIASAGGIGYSCIRTRSKSRWRQKVSTMLPGRGSDTVGQVTIRQ
ncbi:Uncharacterized protein PBTT_01100 [Plasmodiophora brassicae]